MNTHLYIKLNTKLKIKIADWQGQEGIHVQCHIIHWWHLQKTGYALRELNILMQPSMANLNSPSSRIVKDSTPFRRLILRCINFGNGESSPYHFLDLVNLYLIKFKELWILSERAFYSLIILFILKWILT